MARRTYEQDLQYIERVDKCRFRIKKGFVPNMEVEGVFYVNDALRPLMFEELEQAGSGSGGGFLPAVKQVANVASLPGIVGASMGMPDIHSGYGFAIGNVAAFDMSQERAVVSPGGVGFDINCGVRLIRTNLSWNDVKPIQEYLTQSLFDHIPVGVGSQGVIPTSMKDLEASLEMGIDWSLREGYAWAEDKEHCLAPQTEVLLANGTRRAIGDCALGDQLVDEHGNARTITRYSSGEGPLYEVVYNADRLDTANASRFVCNGGHQLVVYFVVGASLTAHEANGTAVDAASPGVAFYRVSYPKMVFDKALGFDVPATDTLDFHTAQCVFDPDPVGTARAAAEAFAQTIPPHLLWEPTVTQYRMFVARYPTRQQWCRMMRAAPHTMPEPSPFATFTKLVDGAYAAAESAGGVHVDVDTRIAPADAAYLVGLWLGNGNKSRACIYMHKPEPNTTSPLDALAAGAPKMGLKVQVVVERMSEQGGGIVENNRPCLHVDLSPTSDGDGDLAVGGNTTDDSNVFVCLLKLLGVFGPDKEQPVSEAAEQAFLSDSLDVRVSLLAGMIDANGMRHGPGWTLMQKDNNDAIDGLFYPSIARLAWRTALSIGFNAQLSQQQQKNIALSEPKIPHAILHITAPSGIDGDILSPRLKSACKRVPATTPDEPTATRWPRGAQLYQFTVEPAGIGRFVSVEVDGPEHRFLLADYLVVHNCEEYGRMLTADPTKVSMRAKKRGLPQLGTLGAGNHYCEVQRVAEIYDKQAASKMGIEHVNQICVLIHSGSRGLGHQVATDALQQMEKAMARDGIHVNDRQLACARINSKEGQDYLAAMSAAANYAWVNRQSMTFLIRQAFAKAFESTPDDLDMHLIYDVSHNIAKVEEHLVDGRIKQLLVHRKGSTRAFPPHHPLIPVDYQLIGQPVLIGGTMGTCSYVLTGTEQGMMETFGSTCHGAGRAQSRNKSRRTLGYQEVLDDLKAKGISIRVASPKLVAEEAPESYKDVTEVVETCHMAGISKKCVKLVPVAVIKG